MPDDELLPLFPLELVLFPGAELPLHIFEPRYRRMVEQARESHTEFGVVRTAGGGVEPVGCTAVVEDVTKRYEDGRFDVATRGVRRFQALDFDRSQDVLRARVEFIDDEPSSPLEPSAVKRLFELAEQAAGLAHASLERPFVLDDPLPSFQAAAALPLDLTLKQELLTLRSEPERVGKLASYLQAWVAKQRATQIMKGRSETNGRAH